MKYFKQKKIKNGEKNQQTGIKAFKSWDPYLWRMLKRRDEEEMSVLCQRIRPLKRETTLSELERKLLSFSLSLSLSV